jgi:hypothetical protein
VAGGKAPRTAVILGASRAPEIAPLILKAYGLTDREREITQANAVERGRGERVVVVVPGLPKIATDNQATLVKRSRVGKRRQPKKWQIEFMLNVARYRKKMRTSPPHTSVRNAPMNVP